MPVYPHLSGRLGRCWPNHPAVPAACSLYSAMPADHRHCWWGLHNSEVLLPKLIYTVCITSRESNMGCQPAYGLLIALSISYTLYSLLSDARARVSAPAGCRRENRGSHMLRLPRHEFLQCFTNDTIAQHLQTIATSYLPSSLWPLFIHIQTSHSH